MSKYIIFRADKGQPHWKGRKLAHTGAGTYILAEHFYSNNKNPKVGDRVTEFVQLEEYVDPEFPGASTHYKKGDWEVTHIEEYTPEVPISKYETVYICYCKYLPIDAPLKPMPPRQISLDSFGGDEKAYKEYMDARSSASVR